MKHLLLLSAFLIFSFSVFCQNAPAPISSGDSLAAARAVDSLLRISKELIKDLAYEQALDNCLLAQKKVLYEFGKDEPAYILTQIDLIAIYKVTKRHTNADSLYVETLQITESLYGKKSIEYAQTLIKLAGIYNSEYERNTQFRREAMQIHQALNIQGRDVFNRITGKIEKDVYFINAAKLAYYCWLIGQYAEWEYISTQIHREMTDMGIKDSYAYVFNLISMAYFYRITGVQEKAKDYLSQSQRLVSSLDIDTIMKIDLYDKLSQLMGWYDSRKGIDWAKKSLNLKKYSIHENRQSLRKYIFGCLYLAESYLDANSDSCELYLNEASKLFAGNQILQQDRVYAYYNWLSGINHHHKKRYPEAYKYCLEAYKLDSALKDKGYMYSSLFNMAAALFYLDSLQASEAVMEKGLQMLESESNFISYFTIFKKQAAAFYSRVGKVEKSVCLHDEILSYWKDTFGETHHEYPGLLNNLGYLYWKMARYASAASAFEESNRKIQEVIKQRFYSSSESEVSGWIQDALLPVRNILFSILNDFPDTALMKTCYDNEIFHKGILRYAKYRIKNLALSDTVSALIYTELDRYYQKLGAEYAKPLLEQKGVKEIQESIMKLETDLGLSIKGKGEVIKDIVAAAVGNALKLDEAAMELVNYDYCIPIANENIHLAPITNYNSTDLKHFELTGRNQYGALLLLPGRLWPVWVPLCDQKSLDSLIQAQGDRKADYVNSLYSIAERGTKPLGKPQKTLYELIWKPIEPYLSGTNTIYYSSAGLLHRLNLSAIPINPDSVLADRYQLVELGNTRQIVIPTERKGNRNDALLFGSIQYDMDSSAISQANVALKTENAIASRGELNFSCTDSTLRGSAWTYLPFTEKEVSGVEQILKSGGIQTQTRKGYTATEEIFKSIGQGGKPSPRILHLATHGFFFPDPAVNRQSSTVDPEPVFKLSDHPMIRSGLLLAGANHAWVSGKPLKPGMEDGILTAYEISQMNLSNTELVVLSACETGLGDIQGNEGVYGLQRAFKIAGAKYLIMSLWQVPDKQTSLLMITFYKKWLEEKMTIPEAFRAAQKELREAGLDPYQWAGFVLVE